MRDHLMGYAPAMREDFREPEAWECYLRFPLGTPARMRGLWEAVECEASGSWQPEGRYVTGRSSACMTKGDLVGLEAQEGPQPTPGEPSEPSEPKAMVTVPNDAGVAFTVDLVRRVSRETPTLSPAAEWPFAGQGWRNGDGGLGAQQERVRLEKLKAVEMRERAIGIMGAAEQRQQAAEQRQQAAEQRQQAALLLGRVEPQAYEASVLAGAEHQRLMRVKEMEQQKAAEHAMWHMREEQRKRDAITACYSDKVRA